MSLDTAEKQKLIETHQVHATDTGSVEVQVAMLSKRISKLSAEKFIKDILINQLQAKSISVGANFRFGFNRSGDFKTIKVATKDNDIKL